MPMASVMAISGIHVYAYTLSGRFHRRKVALQRNPLEMVMTVKL